MYCIISQICQRFYDEEFASRFEQFLERDPNISLASANNEDTPNDNFLDHIGTHFLADNCPSVCSRLWSVIDDVHDDKCVHEVNTVTGGIA